MSGGYWNAHSDRDFEDPNHEPEFDARDAAEEAAIADIKARRYECFIEDHEPLPWTPGRCAGYAGRTLHLYRCKRRDGHGIDGLFCRQHAKVEPG